MVLFIIGSLLYVVTFADLVYTTFSLRGGGFFTSRLARLCWSVLLWSSKKLKFPRLLQSGGMLIISAIFFQWLLLVWGANVLITASDAHAVLHSQSRVPAGIWEKIYVTGYTLSTMGNGDYSGGSNSWKIYLAVISFSGIIMVTISLTYFVQVLSNVNKKRVFASTVNGLGKNVEAILLNAWNGKDFASLNTHLVHLGQQITTLGEIHLSFPVLHYYYSHEQSKSLAIGVALLDETLTALYTRVAPEKRPDHLILLTTRNAITDFLETLHSNFFDKGMEAPPYPEFKNAEEILMPLQPLQIAPDVSEFLHNRRCLLLGLLQNEGREWKEVMD